MLKFLYLTFLLQVYSFKNESFLRVVSRVIVCHLFVRNCSGESLSSIAKYLNSIRECKAFVCCLLDPKYFEYKNNPSHIFIGFYNIYI